MRGPTFIRTKSNIRIMMTIIMKLVPLIPALRLSNRVQSSYAILSFGRVGCQAL